MSDLSEVSSVFHEDGDISPTEDTLIECDAADSDITITLPPASMVHEGKTIILRKITPGVGTVTIASSGEETIVLE